MMVCIRCEGYRDKHNRSLSIRVVNETNDVGTETRRSKQRLDTFGRYVRAVTTLCPKKTCDYIFYNNFNNKCPIVYTVLYTLCSQKHVVTCFLWTQCIQLQVYNV